MPSGRSSAAADTPSPDPVQALFHPVRVRILATLLNERELTVADLSSELPEVPPASLYRHVSLLEELSYIEVVRTRKVRGSVERTYRLRTASPSEQRSLARTLNREDLRRFAMALFATIWDDVAHAEQSPDGVIQASFRHRAFNLTPAEEAAMTSEVSAVYERYMALPKTPDRRRSLLRTIYTVRSE